jgi:hypothetical protein
MLQLVIRSSLPRLHRPTQFHQAPLERRDVSACWSKQYRTNVRRTHRLLYRSRFLAPNGALSHWSGLAKFGSSDETAWMDTQAKAVGPEWRLPNDDGRGE